MATKCIHEWKIDSHNVGTCSLCGEVRQFPMEKGQEPVTLKPGKPPAKRGRPKRNRTWTGIREKHEYYELHRESIVRDLLAIGRPATLKKWGIPTSTITTLERRWLTPDQKAMLDSHALGTAPASRDSPPSANGYLPHFPEFSGTWEPSVQEKWLEIYGTLAVHNTEGKCQREKS